MRAIVGAVLPAKRIPIARLREGPGLIRIIVRPLPGDKLIFVVVAVCRHAEPVIVHGMASGDSFRSFVFVGIVCIVEIENAPICPTIICHEKCSIIVQK